MGAIAQVRGSQGLDPGRGLGLRVLGLMVQGLDAGPWTLGRGADAIAQVRKQQGLDPGQGLGLSSHPAQACLRFRRTWGSSIHTCLRSHPPPFTPLHTPLQTPFTPHAEPVHTFGGPGAPQLAPARARAQGAGRGGRQPGAGISFIHFNSNEVVDVNYAISHVFD